MNRGQLIPVAIFFLLLVALLKMPEDQVAKLVFEILDGFRNHSILGYGLWGGTVLAWFMHSKWQRRTIQDELDRVTKERNRFQEMQLPAALESSNPKTPRTKKGTKP